MDLYRDYIKEREGLELFVGEYGFATYKFRGPDCYIQDIYVMPEHRKEGHAAFLADQIAERAKERGLTKLTGSVDVQARGAPASIQVLTAYGMRPYSVEGNMIYYVKEIR